MTPPPLTDLPVGYRPPEGAFDELYDGAAVRGHWTRVARTLDELGSMELTARANEAKRLLADDGV